MRPAAGGDSQRAEEDLGRGRSFIEKREYGSAVAAFTEAIRLEPKLAEAYRCRGDAFGRMRDQGRAVADFDEAIRLDPKSYDAYFGVGCRLREHAHPDKAVADLSECRLLQGPNDGPAHAVRGYVNLMRGDNDGAIADLTEAIRLGTAVARSHHHRGVAYLARGDFDRAIADSTEVIRLHGQDAARAHATRGSAYDYKGETGKATADYTEAVRLDPVLVAGYCGRGTCRRLKGDLRGSASDYSRPIQPDRRLRSTRITAGCRLPEDGRGCQGGGGPCSGRGSSGTSLGDLDHRGQPDGVLVQRPQTTGAKENIILLQ